ncbi:MAG: hypothetical protein ABID09_03375 [Candidatus Omnitrophota bacterium]
MMKIEVTKEHCKQMLGLLNVSMFKGADAEKIVECKAVYKNAVQAEEISTGKHDSS